MPSDIDPVSYLGSGGIIWGVGFIRYYHKGYNDTMVMILWQFLSSAIKPFGEMLYMGGGSDDGSMAAQNLEILLYK